MIIVMLMAAVWAWSVAAIPIVLAAVMVTQKRHVTYEEMRRRADYENYCYLHGDPCGIYGRFTPHA